MTSPPGDRGLPPDRSNPSRPRGEWEQSYREEEEEGVYYPAAEKIHSLSSSLANTRETHSLAKAFTDIHAGYGRILEKPVMVKSASFKMVGVTGACDG